MTSGRLRIPSAYQLRWRGRTLIYRPAAAIVEWGELPAVADEPWSPPDRLQPRCLTVAFRGRCNLACCYCYGGDGGGDGYGQDAGPATAVAMPALAAAARLVAASCRDLGLPLLVGLHGASEPLQDRGYGERAVQVLQRVAAEQGLELRLACTTNGVLDIETVEWLAATFDSVTVSLDGDPVVQDQQRPLAGGGGSHRQVEATLDRLLRASPRPEEIQIRSTITSHNVERQVELVQRFLDRFPVDRLLFHPLYQSRTRAYAEHTPDPGQMVRHFIAARRLARSAGVELVLAGTRVGEQHGRFCPILQHNLTLTPGGRATACFLALDERSATDQPFFYGRYDPVSDRFVIDQARLHQLLSRCTRPDTRCHTCFNLRHCAQGCPDSCPLIPGTAPDCRVVRAVAFASLLEAAGIELDQQAAADLIRELPPLPTSEVE